VTTLGATRRFHQVARRKEPDVIAMRNTPIR